MSLQDIIAERKALAESAAGVSETSTQGEAFPEGNGGDPGADEPWGVATEGAGTPYGVADVVTPSGLEIHYEAGPKRLYRVRGEFEISPGDWRKGDWQEVPSVSTILDGALPKQLQWWGQGIGVRGTLTLAKEQPEVISALGPLDVEAATEKIVDLLTKNKLTVNHVKDRAAARGTSVHSALETFVETEVLPDPALFPENERGYVEGLVRFLVDANPRARHSELMVASTDGFAGRFDLVADVSGEVVTKTYPKREDKRSPVSGTWLLDLKTSKSVYPSYHLQLAAYRSAMGECGYGEVDHAGVVRVTEDGRYELVECRATYDDFLNVLSVYRSLKRIG